MLKCILHDAGCEDENLPGTTECLMEIANAERQLKIADTQRPQPAPITQAAPKWLLDIHREELIAVGMLGVMIGIASCFLITLIA